MAFLESLTSTRLGSAFVDPTVPSVPVEAGSIELAGYSGSAATAVGLAFLGKAPAGLRVLDVSMPIDPVEITTVGSPDVPQAVVLSGWTAYTAEDAPFHASFEAWAERTPHAPALIFRDRVIGTDQIHRFLVTDQIVGKIVVPQRPVGLAGIHALEEKGDRHAKC